MSIMNLTISTLMRSVLVLFCCVFAACSGDEANLVTVNDVIAEMPEDWGPPEHTHINFTS